MNNVSKTRTQIFYIQSISSMFTVFFHNLVLKTVFSRSQGLYDFELKKSPTTCIPTFLTFFVRFVLLFQKISACQLLYKPRTVHSVPLCFSFTEWTIWSWYMYLTKTLTILLLESVVQLYLVNFYKMQITSVVY